MAPVLFWGESSSVGNKYNGRRRFRPEVGGGGGDRRPPWVPCCAWLTRQPWPC